MKELPTSFISLKVKRSSLHLLDFLSFQNYVKPVWVEEFGAAGGGVEPDAGPGCRPRM